MPREPLIVLAGPTAVGKTFAAIRLCQEFNAEVVSADSVQVYRGLDVGSAKPTAEEMAQARHHLIDVADPDEDFDAARFCELADKAIADIRKRGKKVVVAGGTGLYIRALLHGLVPAPKVDEALRKKLADEWESRGGPAMHEKLAALDNEAAGRIHPADRQRVLRALEVCIQTGEPFSQRQKKHGFKEARHPHMLIGLNRERAELMQRIETRSRIMWESGLIQETQKLLNQGYSPDLRSLGTLGYRHAAAFLLGRASGEESLARMIRDTKAYAKRQLTWFRGMNGIHWHSPDDINAILARAAGDQIKEPRP